MTRLVAALWVATACGSAARPAPSPPTLQPGIDVAVHPGFAVVVERRIVALAAGRTRVALTDLPSSLDPGSVSLRSLTDPAGARVVAQSFEGAVPTWACELEVTRAGRHLIEVVYTVPQVTWRMDYAVVADLGGAAPTVAVRSWATVDNGSDLRVTGARLRVVANASEGWEWEVGERVDLAPHDAVQFAVVPAATVPAQWVYRFDPLGDGAVEGALTDPSAGIASGRAVGARISFVAAVRLPAGVARVYVQRERAEEPVFVAAAPLAASAAGAGVDIDIGTASQLRGLRTQTAFSHDLATGRIAESVTLRVHNDGAETVHVVVSDRLFRAPDARVVDATPPGTVRDGRVDQMLDVPPGQAREARYEAVYRPTSAP